MNPKHVYFRTFLRVAARLFLLLFLLQPVMCNSTQGSPKVERRLDSKTNPFNTHNEGTPVFGEEAMMGKRQQIEANITISVDQPASCPSINAIASTNSTTGPNGSIFFLNCGISATDQHNGGWTPPTIRIDQLVINADFSSAEALKASVFKTCIPFYDMFRNASAAIEVPPILLAAFAMQESACNPRALGSGGTAGLLQLSPDKCVNANCYDPASNINIGAQYLKSLLTADPSIVLAVGGWNGWYKGMTYADATSARSNNCYSQRNLDYLQQYFNGWLQNVNGYGQPGANDRLGSFFNLDVCAPAPLPTWGVSTASMRRTHIYWSIGLLGLVYLSL